MAWHVVEQGEHLPQIAFKYGFCDYQPILDHPNNQPLKDNNRDPHLLLPGDRIFIPDAAPKTVAVATGQLHRFVLKAPKIMLRMLLHDEEGNPLASKPFKLLIGGKTIEGTTNGDGLLEVPIPIDARDGKLEIEGFDLDLHVGSLDPGHEISGVQSRLRNLGYDLGDEYGEMGPATHDAIGRFQQAEQLEVTGEPNNETLAKLKERHKC
jgi:hypothetical protein